jgi:hypothetical protein
MASAGCSAYAVRERRRNCKQEKYFAKCVAAFAVNVSLDGLRSIVQMSLALIKGRDDVI